MFIHFAGNNNVNSTINTDNLARVEFERLAADDHAVTFWFVGGGSWSIGGVSEAVVSKLRQQLEEKDEG